MNSSDDPIIERLYNKNQLLTDVVCQQEILTKLYSLKVPYLKVVAKVLSIAQSGRKADVQDRIRRYIQIGKDTKNKPRLLAISQIITDAVFENPPTPYDVLYRNFGGDTQSRGQYINSSQSSNGPRSSQGTKPWIFFRENPFFILKKMVSQEAGICSKAPDGRGNSVMSFFLNENDYKQLKTSRNIKLYLLCGAYDGAKPTDSFVEFPQPLEITFNGVAIKDNVKGIKNKPGTSKPANLTPYVRNAGLSNELMMVYAFSKLDYLYFCYIIEQVSVDRVLQKILENPHMLKQATLNDFNKDEQDEDDIQEMSTNLSLKCPLSFTRMKYPIKGIFCNHLNCFDALSFLHLQEQAPSWECPLCYKSVRIKELAMNDYVLDILKNTSEDVESVEIGLDGTWKPIYEEDENNNKSDNSPEQNLQSREGSSGAAHLKKSPNSPLIISLDSDDEDADFTLIGETEKELSRDTSNAPSKSIITEISSSAIPSVLEISNDANVRSSEQLPSEYPSNLQREAPRSNSSIPESLTPVYSINEATVSNTTEVQGRTYSSPVVEQTPHNTSNEANSQAYDNSAQRNFHNIPALPKISPLISNQLSQTTLTPFVTLSGSNVQIGESTTLVEGSEPKTIEKSLVDSVTESSEPGIQPYSTSINKSQQLSNQQYIQPSGSSMHKGIEALEFNYDDQQEQLPHAPVLLANTKTTSGNLNSPLIGSASPSMITPQASEQQDSTSLRDVSSFSVESGLRGGHLGSDFTQTINPSLDTSVVAHDANINSHAAFDNEQRQLNKLKELMFSYTNEPESSGNTSLESNTAQIVFPLQQANTPAARRTTSSSSVTDAQSSLNEKLKAHPNYGLQRSATVSPPFVGNSNAISQMQGLNRSIQDSVFSTPLKGPEINKPAGTYARTELSKRPSAPNIISSSLFSNLQSSQNSADVTTSRTLNQSSTVLPQFVPPIPPTHRSAPAIPTLPDWRNSTIRTSDYSDASPDSNRNGSGFMNNGDMVLPEIPIPSEDLLQGPPRFSPKPFEPQQGLLNISVNLSSLKRPDSNALAESNVNTDAVKKRQLSGTSVEQTTKKQTKTHMDNSDDNDDDDDDDIPLSLLGRTN